MERPEALIERLPDCLHWSPDGEIRVVGRRISLFDILKSHRRIGCNRQRRSLENYRRCRPAWFARSSPSPSEHREEVDAYMADYRAELERQEAAYEPTPAALRIRRLMRGKGTHR